MLLLDDTLGACGPNITDPRLNLAIEEHLLRNLRLAEPVVHFYVNEPSVIIGRHQNVIQEVDLDYVRERGIHVVRRLSGGGAVYHDLSNLNFTFVCPDQRDLHNYARFAAPIIRALRELGVEAELRGKSDICAAGRKISGNAQYASGGRLLSHGTLLYDADLEAMGKALSPKRLAIESRAVQSIRSAVVNLHELLPGGVGFEDLRLALIAGIFGHGDISTYQLNADDWEQIGRLAAERYSKWEWNYGYSPRFSIVKSALTLAGKIELRIDVEEGHIRELVIIDPMPPGDNLAILAAHLAGVRYDREALADALDCVMQPGCFSELDKAELLALLY